MKRKKVKVIIAVLVALAVIAEIAALNIKYKDVYKVTVLERNQSYTTDSYTFKIDYMEVLDSTALKERYSDSKDLVMYEKMFGELGKIAFVYAKLTVNDMEKFKKDWWTSFHLEADNAWSNQIDMYFIDIIKDTNLVGVNYQEGIEYDVILPFNINKQQITKKDMECAEDWKYRFVFQLNPITYMDL